MASRLSDLVGEQGAIIPEQKVRNLMHREDGVEAARQGKFHVYPVRTMDEGIAILAGGMLESDGGKEPTPKIVPTTS
jgi:predicted ATP-dependent protease